MIKLFYCISFIILAMPGKPAIDADILLENVNIINVETGKIILRQDVVIIGTKISAIFPHNKKTISAKQTIDGSNKYLIPGLWDMHEHMMRNEWFKTQMPLLRANGITGFREMWGDINIAQQMQLKINSDSLPFFRFVASGHILDGKKPFWKGSIAVSNTEVVKKIVDSVINTNADFIKVYSFLSPEVFQGIAQHCRKKKIPFSGHVPHTTWLTEASKSGMASMEHLYGFLTEACSNSDSAMALMQASVKAFESGTKEERKKLSLLYQSLVLNNFSKDKLQLIAKKIRQNNTHIVPTLVMLRGEYFTNDTSFTNDKRMGYMSGETRAYWEEQTKTDLQNNTPMQWELKRKRWKLELEIMKVLITAKVPIMAGTDADNPYVFPGFSLHDELALYVQCGMTPLEALQSATIVPVKFLRLSDELGTIAAGKLADLVLLEGNPLQNISNTSRVHSVIANGKLYGKNYVDSILKK